MSESKGTVLILGASSVIARAIAAEFARDGYALILAGRDREEVERIAEDLSLRFQVEAKSLPFEALERERHGELIESAARDAPGGLAGAILAFGFMGDAERSRADAEHAGRIVEISFLGGVSALTHLANYFEARGSGFIVGISSVAGDRGRGSNYVYGSAKGGLSLFLQGLRNRLHASGVKVVTVKPGFIDTRMTYGVVPPRVAADPAVVGRAVLGAVRKGKSVVYVPGFWRYIMLAIRSIPESLFKRMKL